MDLPDLALTRWTVTDGRLVPADAHPLVPHLDALPDGTTVYLAVPTRAVPALAVLPEGTGEVVIAKPGDVLAVRVARGKKRVPSDPNYIRPGHEVDPATRGNQLYVVAVLNEELRVDFDPSKKKKTLSKAAVYVPYLEDYAPERPHTFDSVNLAAQEVLRELRPDRRTHSANVFTEVFHRGRNGEWASLGERREKVRRDLLGRE